ncbi:MAG: response regulator [Bacteroidota bacterium]
MRILVVDDNEGYLQLMGDLLGGQGYEVLLAGDGKQARELLEGEKVDVIISDVFMPTLDGIRFHSYVREFLDTADVPFIFVSGYDDEYTRGLVQDAGRDFFFSKTTPIEQIIALIEELRTAQNSKTLAS